MTIICGQDGSGFGSPTTGTDQAFTGGAYCFQSGYTPLFNGTATTAYVYCASGSSATTFQICVYTGASGATGGATLLATSASGTVGSNVLVGVAINAALLTSNTYSLFVSTQTGFINTQWNTGSSASAVSQYNATNFPFATPPGTTVNPRDSNAGHEFTIWLDSQPPNSALLAWVL
jgi:hypothetical protein